MKVILTGGAGYIGSHTAVELVNAGHSVVIVDNLANSAAEAVKRVEEITGATIPFYKIDVRERDALREIFAAQTPDAVIHFAGLKAVGESTEQPLMYYRNNIDSTLTLLEVMDEYDVRQLVFSSSATVYGSAPIPYVETESAGQGITNPYGRTKYFVEEIIRDVAAATPTNKFTILRYFNPIGAHESGRIGEDPTGIPNNLMPFITQVAAGKRDKLSVFGNDYATPDGTCERDYIHVVDLARGHMAALEHLQPGTHVYNLGSGTATSVLELVRAFTSASGIDIPYEFAPRRAGDLPEFYADAHKAASELGWRTEKTLEEACADSWRWQSQNPDGYK